MVPDDEGPSGERLEPTPLPFRNAMHYATKNESIDWSKRRDHMRRNHGITPEVADDAIGDANRVVIDPDYNSNSGISVRIIGYSILAEDLITVIVLEHDGTVYGVNGWLASAKDRRIYNNRVHEIELGEADEQDD